MTGRMRRVNEAVRQVLSEAVVDLKDPRIGFVTVTGVKTSPDLRHARVFVSVLGSERKREQSLEALQAAHSFLQARLGRELRMKRTPQLTFEYDPSVERGVRVSQLIDELAPHENPDGDALGSLLATKLALDRLGKDSYMYLYGSAPLPREYAFMELDDLRRELPPDASERILVALDCANESRLGP